MAKKKILLLADDLRMTSGIANMSKQLVMGSLNEYDWVQIGAAVKHPEEGKILDLCDDVRSRTGIEDAYLKIYPSSGYGTAEKLREVMNLENPDAILHFTDPRYWIWLYDIEHEIRQTTPIFFYHIWDDLPDPKYNRDYYESCDWIGTISKQTFGITNRVWSLTTKDRWKQPENWQVSYVPHGINPDDYKPTAVPADFRKQILGGKDYDFVLYWSNRNIRRKQPIEVIYAFKEFISKLPKEKADKCVLLMHTQPVDENGTDLPKVVLDNASECNVLFDTGRWNEEQLNYLYNIADVTLNVASNEGFGLATAESIMAGTPIIVNVTGGMQDQCGFLFQNDEVGGNWDYTRPSDYVKWGSLHDWRLWKDKLKWGDWVTPVWPTSRSFTGSVPTPYIFEDHIDYVEVADSIKYWYDMSREKRKEKGLLGRDFALGVGGLSVKNMCQTLINGMNTAFKNWKPRKKYELFKIK
jgi:glycosyltransferase involved in cell wall biosynthesis